MADLPISVVIPTHGRQESCRRALESVVAQTIQPVEVMLSEDGCSRFAKALAREFDVRYLCGQRSGTPAVPRNRGLRAAVGRWVAFLDDDDAWEPNKLQAQASFLDGTYVLVAANAWKSSGAPYFNLSASPRQVGRRELLTDNPVITSSAVVDRETALAAGGFPSARRLAGVEDYLLWVAMTRTGGKILVLPQPLVVYHDGSGSARLSDRAVRLEFELARQMFCEWRASIGDTSAGAAAVRHASRGMKVGLRRYLGR